MSLVHCLSNFDQNSSKKMCPVRIYTNNINYKETEID